MRPITKKQNLLKFPLNFIFGQGEAAVRVLRLLSSFSGSVLTLADITGRTGLSTAGVRRVIESLELTGLIAASTSGKKAYALRMDHPLSEVIHSLFHGEQLMFEDLQKSIKKAFDNFPTVASIWIDADYFEPGKPLNVYFVAPGELIGDIKHVATEKLFEQEKAYDLTIRVCPITREDAASVLSSHSDRNFYLLQGLPPEVFISTNIKRAPRTNAEQKSASLLLAEKASNLLSEDPTLIHDVKKKLDEQIERASASTKRELLKWKRLLDGGSIRRIQAVLTEDSEEAERMRQSSPFSHLVRGQQP